MLWLQTSSLLFKFHNINLGNIKISNQNSVNKSHSLQVNRRERKIVVVLCGV